MSKTKPEPRQMVLQPELQALVDAASQMTPPPADPLTYIQKALAEHGASVVTLHHDSGVSEFTLSDYTDTIGQVILEETKTMHILSKDEKEIMRRHVMEEVHRLFESHAKLGNVRLTLLWRNVADADETIDWERLKRFKERLKIDEQEPAKQEAEDVSEDDLAKLFGVPAEPAPDVEAESVTETESDEIDVWTLQQCLEHLHLQPIEYSRIQSENDAKYWLGAYRAVQEAISTTLKTAALILADGIRCLQTIDNHVGRDLAEFAASQLKKNSKGGYAKKSFIILGAGGVFFKKTGGWKVFDRAAIQKFIDELPESELATYGVTTVRKFTAAKLKELAAEGVVIPGLSFTPPNELGTWGVGVDRAWTPEKQRAAISATVKRLKVVTQTEDNETDEAT